jgi:hypothetical protein
VAYQHNVVHFLPQYKQQPTEAQIQYLVNKLNEGYLDNVLHEKANAIDEKITVWGFRFLNMITGE